MTRSTGTTGSAGTTLTLRDGRTLGYLEYGDAGGQPVVFCHGTPGSRLYCHPDATITASLGIRLIAVDRPGYGLSTFKPRRTLQDWPGDVAELADHLGLERFSVVGLSGGGPHALSCAATLGDRITRVGLVASTAPLDSPDAMAGMSANNRTAVAVTRALPFALLRVVYGWTARTELQHPEATLDAQAVQLATSDRAVRESPTWRAMEVENVREAYRHGARGHAWEGHMLLRSWGIRFDAIDAPIHLWQGEEDTLVPPPMGHYLAAKLPRCDATFAPGEGHLALFFNHWGEILTAMVG